MAYFLKQTKQAKRTYLAIYESFYQHATKGTAHKCYRSLGSIETHVKNGILDPVAHFQKDVDALNRAHQETKIQTITSLSPTLYCGYFPLKWIMDTLKIRTYVDYFKLTHAFEYDLFDLLASLVYARSVNPCSKNRTFHEVLPNLYQPYHSSYDQLLDGVSFLGRNYEKLIELFTGNKIVPLFS